MEHRRYGTTPTGTVRPRGRSVSEKASAVAVEPAVPPEVESLKPNGRIWIDCQAEVHEANSVQSIKQPTSFPRVNCDNVHFPMETFVYLCLMLFRCLFLFHHCYF
ncbi:hypothetical protein EON65_49185 [archaeon]|nr:MAG: hypothetical protein EON65_49185 [archaeon]